MKGIDTQQGSKTIYPYTCRKRGSPLKGIDTLFSLCYFSFGIGRKRGSPLKGIDTLFSLCYFSFGIGRKRGSPLKGIDTFRVLKTIIFFSSCRKEVAR